MIRGGGDAPKGRGKSAARIQCMSEKSVAPWKKPAPKKAAPTKLTPASKARAKASAARAGRPYPNLVDNMNAAKAQKEGAGEKKAPGKPPGSPASRRKTRAKT